MASKKKVEEEKIAPVEEVKAEVKAEVKEEKKKSGRFNVGDLVFVKKDVLADLNGFCLFPQYKKDVYTVEAYDAKSGVYSLRQQKLLISLIEADILAPDENAHDSLNRKQF